MSINKAIIVGRLTKDPELRYTPSGVAVATFTLAVQRQFNKDEADFIPVVAWRQLGELCANYLKKGSQCVVDGHIQTRSYDNKEGKRVFVVELNAENVQFLSQANTQGSGQSGNTGHSGTFNDPFANDSKTIDISDDDLPF